MTKKILLADDSITIRKVVGIIFATEDYQLSMADNGDDAFSMAQSEVPDLIIADISMPGKDGFELCRAIKSAPQFVGKTAVMLLPGAFDHFDEVKAQDVCADGWLTKPFESQALLDKVAQLLEAEPLVMAGMETLEASDATAFVKDLGSSPVVAVDDDSAADHASDGMEDAEDIWESVSFDDDLGEDTLASVADTDSFAADVFATDQDSDEFIPDFSDDGAIADEISGDGSRDFADDAETEPDFGVAGNDDLDTAHLDFSDDNGDVTVSAGTGLPSIDPEDVSADNIDFSAFDDEEGNIDVDSSSEFTLSSAGEESFNDDALNLSREEGADEPLELVSDDGDEPLELLQGDVTEEEEPLDLLQDDVTEEEEPLDLLQDEPEGLLQDEDVDEFAPVTATAEFFGTHEPEPQPGHDQTSTEVFISEEEEVLDLSEADIVEDIPETITSEVEDAFSDAGEDFWVSDQSEAVQEATDHAVLLQTADTETDADEFAVEDLGVAESGDAFDVSRDDLTDEPLNLDTVEDDDSAEGDSEDDFVIIDSVVDAETEEFAPATAEEVQTDEPVAVGAVDPGHSTAQIEDQLRSLSSEELKDIVGRVAGPLIENLARDMVEKIVWEVVPDLAEVMIREEIRKITGELE